MTPVAEPLAERAVCLLSLSTFAYDTAAMRLLSEWQQSAGREICFVVLDGFEKVNAETLGLSVRSRAHFEELVQATKWSHGYELKTTSQFTETSRYHEIFHLLWEHYKTERSFQNLVRTQTFKSLHIQLHKLGIRNQRHDAVYTLGKYVIQELALLSLLHENGTTAEVGFHDRGAAANELNKLGLSLPVFSLLVNEAELPSLALESLVVAIPDSSRTVGPVTVDVHGGKILGLVGPNGSGKSTLLRAIAGHIESRSGSIRIAGRDVAGLTPFRRQVATVFQDAGLVGALTAAGNIELGAEVGRQRTDVEAGDVDRLVDTFRLGSVLRSVVGDMSMGERQMVALIRAVMSAPEVLLLDEPTASLDTSRRRLLASVIRETVTERRIPAVVVSHDISFLVQIADKILALDTAGKVAAQGRASEFVTGGGSLIAADLMGVDNVLKITSHTPNSIVLDDWLELPADLLDVPRTAAGIRIEPDKVALDDARSALRESTRELVVIRGTIRARQFLAHGDFIMFEPINTGTNRAGRARGLMLARDASKNLKKMHVDLLLRPSAISWLE